MKRVACAVLAVLIIPACKHHDDDEDNVVTVSNTGDSTVWVEVRHERPDWLGGSTELHNDFELAADDQRTDIYPETHEVRIRITRKSDGFLLYAEKFDLDDFERHDHRIWISVNP